MILKLHSPVITHERSKREIDPSVADILREEASVNANNARLKTSDIRMNLPLIHEPTSDPQPGKAAYRSRADDLDEMYKDTASDAPASRRDLLPDIEEKLTFVGIRNQQAKNSQKHRRKKPLVGVGFARPLYCFGGCCLCLCRFDHIKRPGTIWMPMLRKLINGAALSDQTSGF